jgi:hypothetical protein
LRDRRDGIPKSVFYIFKVHMALEQYEEASNTAIIIAKQLFRALQTTLHVSPRVTPIGGGEEGTLFNGFEDMKAEFETFFCTAAGKSARTCRFFGVFLVSN